MITSFAASLSVYDYLILFRLKFKIYPSARHRSFLSQHDTENTRKNPSAVATLNPVVVPDSTSFAAAVGHHARITHRRRARPTYPSLFYRVRHADSASPGVADRTRSPSTPRRDHPETRCPIETTGRSCGPALCTYTRTAAHTSHTENK